MRSHLAGGTSANLGGHVAASRDTEALVEAARATVGTLLGADPRGVAFGANMTTLTLAFTRAVARDLGDGVAVVCTTLDHDANVSPWMLACADRGRAEARLPRAPHGRPRRARTSSPGAPKHEAPRRRSGPPAGARRAQSIRPAPRQSSSVDRSVSSSSSARSSASELGSTTGVRGANALARNLEAERVKKPCRAPCLPLLRAGRVGPGRRRVGVPRPSPSAESGGRHAPCDYAPTVTIKYLQAVRRSAFVEGYDSHPTE